MEEKFFFQLGDVSVSNSRFIVNGQTYAISNVTSVKSSVKPPEKGIGIAFLVFGFIFLLSGISLLVFMGLLFFVPAYVYLFMSEAEYSVVLHTSSGENQALVSKDEVYIKKVVGALNEAIIARS